MPPLTSIPTAIRILQVATAVVSCFFAAGIIFGYAALKSVLIAEGAYRDRCTPGEIDKKLPVCSQQELDLNFMFTCAAVVTNCCALPTGAILDRYGPRISSVIGGILVAFGCLFMAFARRLDFDAYLIGFVCLALGGPFVFIPSFHLSNAFPAHSGLVLSMLTGAFDASSAVFLGYRLLYTKSDRNVDLQKFFLFYLAVPAFIISTQVFIMPQDSYQTVDAMVQSVEEEVANEDIESDHILSRSQLERRRQARRESALSEVTALLGPKVLDDQRKKEQRKRAISGVWGVLHGKTARQQIVTPWWTLLTAFALVQMIRINYFVATIRPQYSYLFGSEEIALQINEFFDAALPLGGVVSVPFIGLLLDWTSTTAVMVILTVSATVIGAAGLMPWIWAAYTNVILFVVYRPLYYTSVSDYSAKVFGFQTFGTVYGLTNSVSGIFNLVQAGLDNLKQKTFKGNPQPVNVGLLVVGFSLGATLAWFVGTHSQRMPVTSQLPPIEQSED